MTGGDGGETRRSARSCLLDGIEENDSLLLRHSQYNQIITEGTISCISLLIKTSVFSFPRVMWIVL